MTLGSSTQASAESTTTLSASVAWRADLPHGAGLRMPRFLRTHFGQKRLNYEKADHQQSIFKTART